MRISDWSSDVCSSDLAPRESAAKPRKESPTGRCYTSNTKAGARMEARPPSAAASVARRQLGGRVLRSGRLGRRRFVGRSLGDRKSVVWGQSVSVRVGLGGRRIINTKKTKPQHN